MVRVKGFEPPASWSQTTRATSCATPGRRQKKLAPFRFARFAKETRKLHIRSFLLPLQIEAAPPGFDLAFYEGEETRSIPFCAGCRYLRERKEESLRAGSIIQQPPHKRKKGINASARSLQFFHLTAEENCGILSEELFSGRFHFPAAEVRRFLFFPQA